MRGNDRAVWIALGVLVLLLLARPFPFAGGWPPGFGFWGFWHMGLAVWAVLIGALAIFGCARRTTSRAAPAATLPTALEMLRWRYAAGEISREQYVEMQQLLGADGAP